MTHRGPVALGGHVRDTESSAESIGERETQGGGPHLHYQVGYLLLRSACLVFVTLSDRLLRPSEVKE